MSILERLVDHTRHDDSDDADPTIDLTTQWDEQDDGDGAGEPPAAEDRYRADGRVVVRGMRIRRVRLSSVAQIASVFFALGYVTIVGTLVVVWNAARALGFVDSFEETTTTALGLDDRFDLAGGDLFGLVLVGSAVLMLLGLILTVVLALVYNVACALFGGLAVEVGPLRRRRRVFSLRHRGFITIRE